VLWLTNWAFGHGAPWLFALLERSPAWSGVLLNVSFSAVVLLPGFCTGWISGRDGIRLGALTGLIGAITYSAVEPTFHMRQTLGHYITSGVFLIAVAGSSFGLVLTCSAGGALGQLLRSNHRWSGRDS
jgi:hypothetical protein